MRSLSFAASLDETGARARRVKAARFEARSCLPISAASVVANGVRETLSSLLGVPAAMRLFAPVIPAPDAWRVILRNARLYRVRGEVADAAIVLRESDAAALASALFGESPAMATERGLSPIERDVLERLVGAIATNFGTVCGARDGSAIERVSTIDGFVTYFDLLVELPVSARIGIALSRDPSPDRRGALDIGHLGAVELPVTVTLELGKVKAAEIARLAVGSTLPIDVASLARARLTAHGRQIARGGGGVRNARYAFYVASTRGDASGHGR